MAFVGHLTVRSIKTINSNAVPVSKDIIWLVTYVESTRITVRLSVVLGYALSV